MKHLHAMGRKVLVVYMSEWNALNQFCGWFDAQLSPGVLLDTSPSAPLTHWQQHWFPLPPREVAEGSKVPIYAYVHGGSYLSGGGASLTSEVRLMREEMKEIVVDLHQARTKAEELQQAKEDVEMIEALLVDARSRAKATRTR